MRIKSLHLAADCFLSLCLNFLLLCLNHQRWTNTTSTRKLIQRVKWLFDEMRSVSRDDLNINALLHLAICISLPSGSIEATSFMMLRWFILTPCLRENNLRLPLGLQQHSIVSTHSVSFYLHCFNVMLQRKLEAFACNTGFRSLMDYIIKLSSSFWFEHLNTFVL